MRTNFGGIQHVAGPRGRAFQQEPNGTSLPSHLPVSPAHASPPDSAGARHQGTKAEGREKMSRGTPRVPIPTAVLPELGEGPALRMRYEEEEGKRTFRLRSE